MLLSRRRRNQAKQEQTEQNIRHALDFIRPILRIEECALSLSTFDIESGVAVLAVRGGCPDCELSVGTFLQGIETQLKLRVPEIKSVKLS